MRNVILEGANGAGKTTATNILKGMFPESNFLEFHDFHHEHTINQFSLTKLYDHQDWLSLSNEQAIASDLYLRDRLEICISFLKKQKYNRNIIERLLLTHAVYSELLFKIDTSEYFEEFDKRLSNENVLLILISCEDTVMKSILPNNIKARDGRGGPTSQFHLKSIDIGVLKNQMYQKHYLNVKHTEKVIIINKNNGIDELRDQLEAIAHDFSI